MGTHQWSDSEEHVEPGPLRRDEDEQETESPAKMGAKKNNDEIEGKEANP